jgi:hypothetical protein
MLTTVALGGFGIYLSDRIGIYEITLAGRAREAATGELKSAGSGYVGILLLAVI